MTTVPGNFCAMACSASPVVELKIGLQGFGPNSEAMDLPDSREVAVAVLAQMLNDTTNSYKYLFMLSLLDSVQSSYRDDTEWSAFDMGTLAAGMLMHAWYPLTRFPLSFGLQDKVSEVLSSVLLAIGPEKFSFDRSGQEKLRSRLLAVLQPDQVKQLTRYVQHRLIRPFFAQELRGVRDSEINARVAGLAREKFDDVRPLYRLEEGALVLHPSWTAYLREHWAIVRGWICWNWTQYLQSRNPNIPAIPVKLFPPDRRSSLEAQWKFWKAAMEWRCLYSGRLLEPESIALDHFLPWSFVAHDRLWNLLPVSTSANSSKSDSIPHPSYVSGLCNLQARALVAARPAYKESDWVKVIEPYVADLKVPLDLLDGAELELESLERSLSAQCSLTIPSLISLAEASGFQPGWLHGSL